jgi:hypothetical protein
MKHFVPLSKRDEKEEAERRKKHLKRKRTKNSLFDTRKLLRASETRKMCIERKAKRQREEFIDSRFLSDFSLARARLDGPRVQVRK